MIRLIQRRLIIPRGDTGSFSLPVLANKNTGDIAVFTIFDSLTKTRAFQKIIEIEGDILTIAFSHNETVNLKPGKYFWDIKFYNNPQFVEDELVNGDEVDSYYAGFTMPACEIRETADNYLVSPDSPTATLSPEQLDIITGAISELNEAIRKTNENVEHYPEIRDEVWYVWDAEQGDYVSTDVRANGIVGNGIASAVLNDDYTLTLNFTDGTSFTSSSIRGQRGNGIEDIVLNNDFTLTITYTDGDSYVTPSIRGPVGATPQFSIGTVQEGAVAAASITGTAENPVLNLTLPNVNVPTKVSQLENDANYAVDANYVHTDNNYTTAEKEKLSDIAAGAEVNVNADWNAVSGDAQILNKPTKVSDFTNDAGYLTTETDPTVPAWAKAAQKPLYTAAEVGAPTVTEMNTAIREAIGQINSFDIAIVQALPTQDISTHTIYLVPKTGETNDVYDEYIYINSKWEMVGNTQIDLSNYALKSELPTKVSELSNDSGYLTSYTETDPTVPQWAKANTKPSYTATEVGALPSDTHIPSTTAELTNDAGFITANDIADAPVQVEGTSPTIVCEDNHRYICGEVLSLNITPPANGVCEIIFESGSTATLLTAPNTIKWPEWFNPNSLETNATYQFKISNGLANVAIWPDEGLTGDTRVRIQKMLGVYEAPWELIREDTFTNETEANHIITADSNGQSFELTDVILLFEMQKQEIDAKFSGNIYLFVNNGGNSNYKAECSAYTQTANSSGHGCAVIVKQNSNMFEMYRVSNTTTSNTGTVGQRYGINFGIDSNNDRVMYKLTTTPITIYNIKIEGVLGNGHYYLYGKRKWQ